MMTKTCFLSALFALAGASCAAVDIDDPAPSSEPTGTDDSDVTLPGLPEPPDQPPELSTEPLLAIDVSHWTRTITDPDVDCFWEQGYRHVIVGTQLMSVSREQLAIALRGGMTVDLYVYLYWSDSVESQMQEALDLIAEYPEIGRVWIDIEEDPIGLSADGIVAYAQACIDYLGGFPVGIYTGKGFWDTYMDGAEDFSHLPLWYARYDNVPSLDTYSPASTHSFGGWDAATGKQFDDNSPATCGRAVDKNVMIRNTLPQVVVDRSPQADDGDPPEMLLGQWPADGIEIETDYVRPTAIPSLEATRYEFVIEHWNGSAYRPYFSTFRNVSDLTFFPTLSNRSYRWRVRAENLHGPGLWSDWAWFDFR